MSSSELVFKICSTLVLPQWLLMIFLPKWHITKWLVRSRLIPVLLAVIYGFYIIPQLSPGLMQSFGTLEGVKSLFTKDQAVLAGWIHYLAFDLFIGGWMFQNSQGRHVPHYMLIPAFILTFMLGPLGLLFYVIVRTFYPPQIQAVL